MLLNYKKEIIKNYIQSLFFNEKYNNRNSYAETYGLHRGS